MLEEVGAELQTTPTVAELCAEVQKEDANAINWDRVDELVKKLKKDEKVWFRDIGLFVGSNADSGNVNMIDLAATVLEDPKIELLPATRSRLGELVVRGMREIADKKEVSPYLFRAAVALRSHNDWSVGVQNVLEAASRSTDEMVQNKAREVLKKKK